jgi:hypothetical protein
MANHAATTLGSMKTLLLTLGMAAALVGSSYAVEYVTLFAAEQTVSLSTNDVVEVVAAPLFQTSNGGNFESSILGVRFGDSSAQTSGYRFYKGGFYTGISLIEANIHTVLPVTLRIRKANEINAVAPTSVLVIPENSTGNYNIVVETSSDTATWTPFHSQTVSAADAKRFFRTRIVKAE